MPTSVRGTSTPSWTSCSGRTSCGQVESGADQAEDVANHDRVDRDQVQLVDAATTEVRSSSASRWLFDFINGFHDAANSIATVVSHARPLAETGRGVGGVLQLRRVPRVRHARSRTTIAQRRDRTPRSLTPPSSSPGSSARSRWDMITWWLGLPTSSSHALIGGHGGRGGGAPAGRARSSSGLQKIAVFIVLVADHRHAARLHVHDRDLLAVPPRTERRQAGPAVPADAAVLGGRVQPWPRRQRRAEDDGRHPRAARSRTASCRRSPACRCGSCSRAHGDRARHAVRRLADRAHDGHEAHQAPARRRDVRRDRGRRSRCSSTTHAGIPVSTTHTITGAIVGVGSTQRLSAVRWGVAGRVVWAWVLTIPAPSRGVLHLPAVQGAHMRTISRRTWFFLIISVAMLLLYDPTHGQVPLGQPRDGRTSGVLVHPVRSRRRGPRAPGAGAGNSGGLPMKLKISNRAADAFFELFSAGAENLLISAELFYDLVSDFHRRRAQSSPAPGTRARGRRDHAPGDPAPEHDVHHADGPRGHLPARDGPG